MNLFELKTNCMFAIAAAQEVREKVNPLREELERQIAQITQQFEEEHGALLAENERLSKEATEAEKALRDAIVETYRANVAAGNLSKQLGDGLSVQVRTKFTYDNNKAVLWAEASAPMLIQKTVDAKKFEALVKDLDPPLSFVTITETPTAVIKF